MQEKNAAYHFWEDRHSHLFGRLLLLKAFKKHGISPSNLFNIEYNYYGRPYLPNSDYDFNISHSGNFVICAMAKKLKIGIDIETIKAVDFREFEDVMNEDQWNSIHQADDSRELFFNYWAIKESVIKADSRGLSLPLKEITINYSEKIVKCQNHIWHFIDLGIDKKIAAFLTTKRKLTNNNLKYVDFYGTEK